MYFPESHQWSEISSLSKVILVLGKVRSHRVPNLGFAGGLSHLGDLMFHQNLRLDMMYQPVHCRDKAANHQLPVAVAFGINQIVSAEECSSLMQN